nr:hypothetical protein [Solirubrobacterales bacterium]
AFWWAAGIFAIGLLVAATVLPGRNRTVPAATGTVPPHGSPVVATAD